MTRQNAYTAIASTLTSTQLKAVVTAAINASFDLAQRGVNLRPNEEALMQAILANFGDTVTP